MKNKIFKKSISSTLAIAVLLSSILTTVVSPMTASAANVTQATYYVSPMGDDGNAGTQASPYKTLAKAKEVVRTLPKTGGDIVVQIADGFYPNGQTLVFDKNDSGSATCTIRYEAAPGAKPVISGGNMLEKGKWTEATDLTQTGGLKAYKTTLVRDEKLRAIYVNDKRANMTVSPTITSGNRTTTGVPTVSFNSTNNPWAWQNGSNIKGAIVFGAGSGLTEGTKNPQNIEAESLGGARWARPFVCFASAEAAPTASGMSGTILRFQMPYAAISQSLGNNTQYNPDNDQVIRNAFEFMNKRGDFYFDQADSTLYYIPLEGENINEAEVVIPKLETVIDLRGTPVGDRLNHTATADEGRVKNITFNGLTFAHTDYKLYELTGTYKFSDRNAQETTSSRGFASVQGCIVNKVYFPSYINWHETFYRGYDIPPAAVMVNAARNIKVLNGEIGFTGFNGIHLENDVKNCEVTGNYIVDTLSSGIVVGHPQHIYENDKMDINESSDTGIKAWSGIDKEKFKAGTEAVPENIDITNNFLYRNCYGFPGANSLTSFYTTNMQVLHNYLYDSTYGAMSIGWGWCEYDGFSYTAQGTTKAGGPYAGTSEDSKARSREISTTSRNNKINYNRIEEICTKVNDSGAIYSLGRQGDPGNLANGGTWDTVNNLTSSPVTDPNSNWNPDNWTNFTEMNYNFLDPNHTNRPQNSNDWTNGFHPDEGSTFIKMNYNVVQAKLSYSLGRSRLFEFNNWKRKSDMTAVGGYVDGDNDQNGGPRITANNYKSVDRIWPVAGNKIVLDSGLTDEYTHMIPRSLIADTEFELASNVIMGKAEPLNRRGLLKAEDTVWLAPANTSTFIEGTTMTKAAGNAKTIIAPSAAGEYKLYIVYGDGRAMATSKYTAYVDTSASAVNVEDGKSYEVSAVQPLKLTLGEGYTYTLNDKSVVDGYEISTEGSWTLVLGTATKPNFKTIKFTTAVSEANKLLQANMSVAPGGTVRFAYDLNDVTKKIWISSPSGGHFDGGDDETMTSGDKLGITAPMTAGTYIIYVLSNDNKVLSMSHARVVVRDMTPVDIPRTGLDLWLKADEGVQTDSNGNVTGWTNMGSVNAKLVPADVTSSGGDGLGTPTGNPKLMKDVYDYVDFAAMSRPLKDAGFKDYNGKEQMTIYTLVNPTATANNSSDQSGLVYFGLNEANGTWASNDGWSGLNLGVGTNRVNLRFGTAAGWPGGGSSFAANITGLTSVRAQLNGSNRAVYVNKSLIGSDNNSTALKGNRSDLSVGYSMASATPYRFLGRVAQVLIYDRVLTPEEVTKVEAYFDEVKAGRGGPANPVTQAVDKTLLNALIKDVTNKDETIYTADSWSAFASALSEAQTAASNVAIGQEAADNSYYALRNAFKALSVKPSGIGTAEYGTPVLGGSVIDPLWNKTVTLPNMKHLTMANGPTNGTTKVMWDEKNLYVLARVNDPVLNSTSGNVWEKDSIEIFVDETNSKAASYGTGMGQYRINYLNEQTFNPGSVSAGFVSYAKVVDGGYYIETKIPFKVVVKPTTNHVIGFDLQINDARATGGRQDVIMWHDPSGQSYTNGSKWGVVTLVGEVPVKIPYVGEVITPVAITINQNSVTLNQIQGYEYAYALKGASAPTVFTSVLNFTGLKPDTEYDFYQRVAETTITLASTATKATIRTATKPIVTPDPLIPLAGLDVWLKADDANIVKDSNNRVLEWANLINGDVLTPVNSALAAKLMRDENAEVPYNYIMFDSLDSRLEGNILPNYNGSKEMTVIVVTQPTAAHNDFAGYGDKFSAVYMDTIGDWGGVGITATTDGVHGRFGNGMGPFVQDPNLGPDPVVKSQKVINGLVSIRGVKNKSVLTVNVNNKDGVVDNVINSSVRREEFKNVGTTLAVGGVLNNESTNRIEANAFKGRVAEVIIYNHDLTVAELESVNTYISAKYFSVPTPPADTTAPTWAENSTLTAPNVTSSAITLTWSPAQDNTAVTGYKIFNGSNLVTTVTGDVLSYEVTGLTPETTYTFKVLAGDAANNWTTTGPSKEVTTLKENSTPPVADTTAPTWVNSTLSASEVSSSGLKLTWTAARDDKVVTSYRIYKGTDIIATVTGSALSYVVTALTPDTTYKFKVEAGDEAGNWSSNGASKAVTTSKENSTPPIGDTTAPTWVNSTLSASDVSSSGLKLTWTAAQDDIVVTSYRIYKGTDIIATVTGSALSYDVTELSSSTTYTFTIQAVDGANNCSNNGPSTTVTTSSSGGSTSTPVTPPVTTPETNTTPGKVKVAAPVVDAAKGTATITVDAAALTKAFTESKVVLVEIPKATGADSYVASLPALNLASGDATKFIQVATEIGTFTVPSNMLSTSEVNGAAKIDLIIGKADTSNMDAATKATVGDKPVIKLSLKIDGITKSWNNVDAPVKVTIPYTPTASELADPEHITVWNIDGAGKVAPIPSARYDVATGNITFTTTSFSEYAVVNVNKTFSDIQNSWAQKVIEVMASKGVIGGTSETTYSPGSKITRADFLLLLVKALELNAKTDENFDDVAEDSYYYNAIAIAKKLGITDGVGDNNFDPKASISRQDMMVLAKKAMEIAGKDLNRGSAADIADYKDGAQVSGYAQDAVAALVKEGIIGGSDNKLNPKQSTTRAETAAIIYKLYNK